MSFTKVPKVSLKVELMALSDNPQIGETHFTCPVCLELMVNCVTTQCGHSFCDKCVFDYLFHSKNCPNCRTIIEIDTLIKNKLVNKIVEKLVRKLDTLVADNYFRRQKEAQEWAESKKLKNVLEGMLIDMRDSENIWCLARIKKVFRNNDHSKTLLVHYEKWNSIYDEFVCQNSERVAPKGFFTSRKGMSYKTSPSIILLTAMKI
jgi:hypothetical protein